MSNGPGRFYSGGRVLVTGGLGFLGLNLIARLVGTGAAVRVLYRTGPSLAGLRASALDGVEGFQGDIRDADVVRQALDGCELVFNLAGRSGALASNRSPFEDLDVNVRGQLTLLEACSEVDSPLKVIFPSSR